jgi:tight adherence protein C
VLIVVVSLVAVCVASLVLGIGAAVAGPDVVVRQRLAELKAGGSIGVLQERRRRVVQRDAVRNVLRALGERISSDSPRRSSYLRRLTLEAGYRHRSAPAVFTAIRFVALGAGLLLAAFLASAVKTQAIVRAIMLVVGALGGWMIPFLLIKQKVRARKQALQKGLADALDLMVVCVEAGLGTNQALLRVAEEMGRVGPEIGEELAIVMIEMRAGTPRDVALRNLADRTGLEDMRAWANMMIQTDRFGTSIAESLRIHSDGLRTKRRQRSEEAAAKLTVKMLIPLVLFVFPAMLVVILGPAILMFVKFLSGE